MPRRQDLKSILILGSGPIVIGQACEFDYSGSAGVQVAAQRRLSDHPDQQQPCDDHDRSGDGGSDLHRADHARVVAKIIEKERPDAMLPTLGGQTALNCAMQLHDQGVLDQYDVEMIGAKPESIIKAEGRQEFREAMENIGLEVRALAASSPTRWPRRARRSTRSACRASSAPASRWAAAAAASPTTSRSSRTSHASGLELSLNSEILIEESIIGWKEYELEVDARQEGQLSSSSARSRTSTRWACTPATRSRSRRLRR